MSEPSLSSDGPSREIFGEALGLAPAARAALLDARCGGDAALRDEVELLLRFHSDDDGFLERPALEESGEALGRAMFDRLAPGTRLGNFAIIGPLGAGGMGVVYAARQDSPPRPVALKLIRPVLMTEASRGRFAREAAALGRLRHPGIARIYDAGETQLAGASVPYLVMELVEGEPLTRFARERHLSVRQRLDLFAAVCDAVAHAHERGVVHRDLKPGNILVEGPAAAPSSESHRRRGAANPKILDFGVARIVAPGDFTGEAPTMHTRAGQLVGTLAYMAPEQASGAPDAVDTRSDVYSLGVILYELLAGRLPIDIGSMPIPAAARALAERQPAPLRAIDRGLRGDIETIAAKALEKDPARRYPSAAALADDIRRHLDDLPIAARPPSAFYQLRKFSRRHRAAAGAMVAVGVVLAGSVAALSVLLARAQTAEAAAQREAAMSGAVAGFLDNMLGGISPDVARGMDTELLRAILDRAAARMDEYSEHPIVESRIRMTIADTYDAAGSGELALPHVEAALSLRRAELGAGHAESIASLLRLGELWYDAGDYESALATAREAETLALAAAGDDGKLTLWAQNNIVTYSATLSRADEVDQLSLHVLDSRRRLLGADHPDTLMSMGVRLQVLWDLGRLDQAADLGRQTLEARTRVLGPDDPATLTSANNLAGLYDQLDRTPEAIEMHERVLEARRRLLGDDHPYTLASMNNLAACCNSDDGDLARAEELYLEAMERLPRVHGAGHPNVAFTTHNLATLYRRQLRHEEAEVHARRAVELARQSLPAGAWQVGALMVSHGANLTSLQRYEEAEGILLEAHAAIMQAAGSSAERAARSAGETLVRLYEQWGRPEQADQWRLEPAPQASEASSTGS